jgi:hypothetical protein
VNHFSRRKLAAEAAIFENNVNEPAKEAPVIAEVVPPPPAVSADTVPRKPSFNKKVPDDDASSTSSHEPIRPIVKRGPPARLPKINKPFENAQRASTTSDDQGNGGLASAAV